jgi:hypothetical protein
MVLTTIVTRAYKPTYNWGASHCSITFLEQKPSPEPWIIDPPGAFVDSQGAAAVAVGGAQELTPLRRGAASWHGDP